MKPLYEILCDCRCALIWLRLLEDDDYTKEAITTTIKKVDEYIENELKESYIINKG